MSDTLLNYPNYIAFDYEKLLVKNFQSKARITILYNQHFCLIPHALKQCKEFHLLGYKCEWIVNKTELARYEHSFLAQSHIDFYYFPKQPHTVAYVLANQGYLNICLRISYDFYHFIYDELMPAIYLYLKQRHSQQYSLMQMQAIQFTFAKILATLAIVNELLGATSTLSGLNNALSKLSYALQQLIKLGGARSVLRGNALEILFHLNFFKQLFINVGNSQHAASSN